MTVNTIAFYSPLKPADHPTPSGDRLMARQLIHCLGLAGFTVDVASRLRVFIKDPDNQSAVAELERQADVEMQRLRQHWKRAGVPVAWFCYHPYYKSPDMLGPALCDEFDIPYMTAEASYSARRGWGVWESTQDRVLQSIKRAAVNICFTDRDKAGLEIHAPDARLASLRPFIETEAFAGDSLHADVPGVPGVPGVRGVPGVLGAADAPVVSDVSRVSKVVASSNVPKLVTVAMMRSGDKMKSYASLASALGQLLQLRWSLSVVGDGPRRDDVHALFADFPEDRIHWHGRMARDDIAALFARSTLYVWPGCGEAYGLAYLEAQAAALPVVAFDTAGVPAVVDSGYSGILMPVGNDDAFAEAISRLLLNPEERMAMALQARRHAQNCHGFANASLELKKIVNDAIA